MSAKVTFLEPEPEPTQVAETETFPPVVVAPRSTIVRRNGEQVVFSVETNRARMRRVTTGGERDGLVVIREGLSGGERLVDSPPDELADGDEVRIEG
jgi:multidrug efflux pump subunit AcrA (membrane-fusion protein)